jgi:hypothetical protein
MRRPILIWTMVEVMDREKKYIVGELVQVKGLMPLLMKPRNKQKWTPQDRLEVVIHLRRLSMISPYLAVMVLPGSFVMLPALAWWLDRRRKQQLRKNQSAGQQPGLVATVQDEAQSAPPPQKS